MDKKNFFILAVLGVLAWVGYRKFNLAKNVLVRFKNAGLNGGTFPNYNINVTLDIVNPTTTSAQIQGLNGELILQNTVIGYVNEAINYTIKPNTTSSYSFDISVNLFSLAGSILDTDLRNERLTFNGNLTVDFISIPVYFDYNLSF